eukprot:TRINITY_DN11576_c0_g1_i2.p1 TRINITY_DN11576_c0_g1~~TRINITY_DN11576_c0_g1_i2.p1  ORF type:complete len:343 (-),score=91.79 TRINITY_DN11576_c0_g1_i2:124-1152(-)
MLARFGRTALSKSGLLGGGVTTAPSPLSSLLKKTTPAWMVPLKGRFSLFSSDASSSSASTPASTTTPKKEAKQRINEHISRSSDEFTVERPAAGYAEGDKNVWKPTLDSIYNETPEGREVLDYQKRKDRQRAGERIELPESYTPTYIPKKPTPLEDKVTKDHFEGDYVPDREEADFKPYEPTKEELELLRRENSPDIKVHATAETVWQQTTTSDAKARAVGRRKRAVANVVLIPNGAGKVVVNRKLLPEYFPEPRMREKVLAPYVVTETLGQFDTICNVTGGGVSAQSVALSHGISRALQKWNPAYRPGLKIFGLLTRDPREVERKKPGQKKARKKFQWVKR